MPRITAIRGRTGSTPDVVGHLFGNLHRELHEAGDGSRAAPDGLIDQFAHAAFLDRVDVAAAVGQKTGDDRARAFVVAGDERAAAYVAVHLDRAAVLVEYDPFAVADRRGAVEFVGPRKSFGVHVVYVF